MQQTVTITATMAAFPARPASPTLTNPDMILPYGEYDSTPSPPQPSFGRNPGGDQWRGSAPSSLPFSIGPPRAPLNTATPIIYGNGTMLSDIGEVTEAESTPGRRLPGPAERRLLKQAQGPLRSSPSTAHHGTRRLKPGSHERKISLESASTVTEAPQSPLFRDFDDSVSVDDSNFQGDDEGSVADSYSEEVVAMEIQRLSKLEDSFGRDDDPNSSAALSRRAEEILLNAKMRLNNMEGNLTRARSSLYTTPSGVMSSIHSSSPLSRSTPSPRNDPKISSQPGILPAKHRQFDAAVNLSNSSPGHSRAYSENSIASGAGSGTQHVDTKKADSNRSSLPLIKNRSTSLDGIRSSSISTPSGVVSPLHSVHLEPLNEDEAVPGFNVEYASISSNLELFDSGGEQRFLTRSTSSMQMRDLRDQMHDLKGRLSVLRDRARDDNMKRRSLQGLRTPSPFTAADQWYTTDKGYATPGLGTDAGVRHVSGEKVEMGSHSREISLPEVNEGVTIKTPDYCESETTSIYEEAIELHEVDNSADNHELEVIQCLQNADAEDGENVEVSDDVSESHDGVANRDENDIYESDSSIYHDATSISHEDREDAFDYEHFFLHSMMGTINQQRLERRGSFSSEDSADTARGPQADESRSLGLRSESAASNSTVNSFATATEGLGSEADDQEYQYDYAVQRAVAVPVSPVTADAVKRSTVIAVRNPHNSAGTPTTETERPISAVYSPEDRNSRAFHRPSVTSIDSFQSTSTTRGFPLVDKSKSQSSITPINIWSINHSGQPGGSSINGDRSQVSPVQMLPKEDQLLVEQLVATLGKCVSGLQEAPAGSPDAILWRRRLEEARKILDI